MRIVPLAAFAALSTAAVATPAQAELIYALLNNEPSVGQQLVTFESTTRAVTRTVLLQTPDTLSPLASIDVRPATGQLYGYDATRRQLLTINPSTGALANVGSPLPATPLPGETIDFNPTVDLIRLIGSNEANFRVSPVTGAATVDPNLAFAAGDVNAGDNPNIRGIGYTNSRPGATSTILYDVDVDNDVLARQDPANAGTLVTVGPLGVNLNTGLFGSFNGFDISGLTNTAYLTDGGFAGPSNFYTVNLTSGAATSLGTISGLPAGRTVAQIAVAFPVPEPTALAALAGVAVMALRRR